MALNATQPALEPCQHGLEGLALEAQARLELTVCGLVLARLPIERDQGLRRLAAHLLQPLPLELPRRPTAGPQREPFVLFLRVAKRELSAGLTCLRPRQRLLGGDDARRERPDTGFTARLDRLAAGAIEDRRHEALDVPRVIELPRERLQEPHASLERTHGE